jgi:replicative DNA helicase
MTEGIHIVVDNTERAREVDNELFKEFLDNVEAVDQYCKNRGILGGLDFGFPQMTHHLDGLQPGITLIAGQPNTGKSAITLQIALQVAQNNDKVYCMYHSIDDNKNEIMPRAAATLASVPINSIKFPEKLKAAGDHAGLARRARAIEQLKALNTRFGIRDDSYNGEGSDIESIEESVRTMKMNLPEDVQICLFIDNFHDLDSRTLKGGTTDNAKYNYICDQLTRFANTYDMPIVCTAELRKLNGFRRPTIDDVRETTKIGYQAKAIMLCYNEVGLKGENADIYWERPGITAKQPVLEIQFGKNKYSSFKGRLFYNFSPEMSKLVEMPEEGAQILRAKIHY